MTAARSERDLKLLVFIAVILAVSAGGLGSEPYTNVASLWDLGEGARSLALGGAFIGLVDDSSAVNCNPAGLAWCSGLSLASSAETRPATAGHGHVTARLQNLGMSVHYFDFGDVPETDEFGNVIGTFSYRNYGLLAATSVSASNIPILSSMQLADCIAFGLSTKLVIVDTLELGDGSGFAADLSFLLRLDDPWFAGPLLARLAFGMVAENLFAVPVTYNSGHTESWEKRVSIGLSAEALEQFVACMEVRSTEALHLGLEWSPVPALALRCGLKRDGIWICSFGLGVRPANYVFDYALVLHPYLSNQHRASFAVSW